jgi:hypothetical protein
MMILWSEGTAAVQMTLTASTWPVLDAETLESIQRGIDQAKRGEGRYLDDSELDDDTPEGGGR